MASSKTLLEISILVTITVLIHHKTEAIKPSNLLSLLTNRLHHDKQPVIIVISRDPAIKKDRARVDKALSVETSGESVHRMHHLLGHDQPKKKAIQHKRSTLKPYHRDEKKRQRFRSPRLREEEKILQKQDKNVLRSPIVKQLLRISNSLRCQAQDECQDKCSIRFNGLKGKKCQIQCEIKYICEEEEEKREEEDSCENGDDNDSCGRSEEMNSSTKGEKMSDDDNSPSLSLSTLELEVTKYLDRESTTAYNVYPGVEMIDYDYAVERNNQYSTNVLESTAHLIKGCLGVGILGMHEAYMYGGLWTSLGLTVVVGYLVSYSMWMLAKSAQTMYGRLRVAKLSYPDLAEVAMATGPLKSCRRFSKAFRYLTDVFLFINFNGTCCVFEIMIAQTLKQVLASLTDYQLSMNLLILIITVPLVGLCVIRSLKYLAPFSLVADLIVVLCVLTTMFYSISVAKELNKRPAWKSMHGMFRFLGICIYSINGIGVALPIENNMRRPQYFRTVLQWGMPFVVTLVMIIGFFGYWAWGEQCQSPFTIHMPSKTILIVMQGLLAITLGVTFAVHFWVPFRIIWHYLGRNFKTKRGIWERCFRIIYVFLISCLSIAFPNMGTWMSFLGNFFTAFLVFIFPPIMETMITWTEPRKFRFRFSLLKNISFVLFGLFLGGGAFYSW